MTKSLKIINVVGARPNFIKIIPLIDEYKKHPGKFQSVLLHTGQHYDFDMSKIFFHQLSLTDPDIHLGVGSGSHAEQTAKIMSGFEQILLKEKPNLIVVVGDVNSTLACSIVAAKLTIPIAHVEAGLRSFDRTMPEEINRIVTDALSHFLFTTCEDANLNLKREGIPETKIHFVGNVMIDSLMKFKDVASRSSIRETLGVDSKPYGYITLHRPSNVDSEKSLKGILKAFEEIQRRLTLVWPVHPRTKKMIETFGLNSLAARMTNVVLCEPLGYLDSLHLMMHARLVLTDSGGIQEETTVLKVPCLTLRENTERPITITEGTNTLVGNDPAKIVAEAKKILSGINKTSQIPQHWDGTAAKRIVDTLLQSKLN
ncbi:MAG: non-hydrolyzing UDP-N-acetylglucosamine 2-epimerase [Bacteroidota bacterium]